MVTHKIAAKFAIYNARENFWVALCCSMLSLSSFNSTQKNTRKDPRDRDMMIKRENWNFICYFKLLSIVNFLNKIVFLFFSPLFFPRNWQKVFANFHEIDVENFVFFSSIYVLAGFEFRLASEVNEYHVRLLSEQIKSWINSGNFSFLSIIWPWLKYFVKIMKLAALRD